MDTPTSLGFELRQWKEKDAPALVKMASDNNVWIQMVNRFPQPCTLLDAENWILKTRSNFSLPAVFAIDMDGKVIGGIGVILHQEQGLNDAELGYWLDEQYWNRGIMTEAIVQMVKYTFKTFAIARIFAEVLTGNKASIRVLEKAGFTREKVLYRVTIRNGRYIDGYVYSITDSL